MDDYDGAYGVEAADMETHIPESNVGYKLLLKMGWKAGTGLGANATGMLFRFSLIPPLGVFVAN